MTNKHVLLLTKDLFFVPTVRQATESAGYSLLVSTTPQAAPIEQLSATDVVAWVIDLNAISLADIAGTIAAWSASFPTALRVSYAPHVQTARLAAATQAGCQQVLSRGQLSSQFERILRAHST